MNRKIRAAAIVHIIVRTLVFVMFSVLAINLLRGISVLDSRVSNVANSLARLDDRTNDADYYHRIEYDTLAQRTQDLQRESQDLRHTLYNETSLVFPRLIKRVMPAVVVINKRIESMRESKTKVRGSGFVFDAANGYIITAKHVIGDDVRNPGVFSIKTIDEVSIRVVRIFVDTKDDCAVLVIDTDDSCYSLGSQLNIAGGNPERGDLCIVFGHPFGREFSATSGIISNLNVSVLGRGTRTQFDAANNPGGSGGPLINILGDVIGIVVSIQSNWSQDSGVSFAVPVGVINDCITRFKAQLITGIIESEEL